MRSEWHTFATPDLHSDAAVFQFQLLYEHQEMFRRQRWLGARAAGGGAFAVLHQPRITQQGPQLAKLHCRHLVRKQPQHQLGVG